MPNGEERLLPLLRLPVPETADRAKGSGGPSRLHRPGHGRIVERVGPRLTGLQDAFEARRVELRTELLGVEPELALVFETFDSVARFQRAVEKIAGMEWLAAADEVEIPPDEDFYLESKRHERIDRSLGGTLYLVMSNRQAVEQLLSLWERYRKDPSFKFPTGLTPWRDLFVNLREVRLWGIQDRFGGTGILEQWKGRLTKGEDRVRAQVELWFRRSENDRDRQLGDFVRRLEEAGGSLIGQSVAVSDIAYHACVAEVPRQAARQVLAGEEVAFARAEGVMFFRPTGQFVAPVFGEETAGPLTPQEETPPSATADPTVALFDGLPLEGHVLLRGRMVVDDPDGWAAKVPAAQRRHGTAMASLILRGDPPIGSKVLSGPLYVRPVLSPVEHGFGPAYEQIPEDVLEIDLVHRAVRRVVVGEAGELPAAAGVVVVNFSVGDPSRPFAGLISPMARLLDWLAWNHELLFVVSAGNPGGSLSLELSCARGELQGLSAEELQRLALRAMVEKADLRGLFSPAESVNALTVGASHRDMAGGFDIGNRIDPFSASRGRHLIPSPVGSVGAGVGRSIKPDVLFPGGRFLYRERLGTAHERATLEPSQYVASPPGQQVATPGLAGETSSTIYTCGTSNAAALATRAAARRLEILPELLSSEEGIALPSRRSLAPLLKALIVHCASWGSTQQLLDDLLEEPLSGVTRAKLGRFLGYGFADESRLDGCTPQRVTLVAWDDIRDGEGHLYRIPLPTSLSGVRVGRRLIVTLAYLTPINPFDKRYRRAHVWFTPKETGVFDAEHDLRVKRQEADQRAAVRGTVQHEIFEGDQAAVFAPEQDLVLKVNCREHAGRLTVAVPYALAVSLEVAPEVDLPIYEEVRARLRPRVPVRP